MTRVVFSVALLAVSFATQYYMTKVLEETVEEYARKKAAELNTPAN